MPYIKFTKDDIIFWAILVIGVNIVYTFYPALAFIFLGAGLIFWGPFLVLERFAYPGLRNHPRLAILIGWLATSLGGYIWYLVFQHNL